MPYISKKGWMDSMYEEIERLTRALCAAHGTPGCEEEAFRAAEEALSFCDTVVTDALGWLRPRALGGEGGTREGGDAGGVVALLAPSSSSGGKQEVAACVLACGGHAPLPTGVR